MPDSPQLSPGSSATVAAPSLAVRDLRLRRHADFQLVYKKARKQYAKEMTFFFALRTDTLPLRRPGPHHTPVGPRIGLTVGKVLGKAHDRNRIKRRLREAVRMHAGLLENLSVDVVLHPRRTVLTLDWARVEREVASIFRTIRKLAAKLPAAPPAPPQTTAARTISAVNPAPVTAP